MLLVCVEDDGTVSGSRSRHEARRTDPLRVQALIADMTQSALGRRDDREATIFEPSGIWQGNRRLP